MKIKFAILSIITAGLLCISCNADLAKGSETEILTFKFEEYPQQQVSLTTEGIVSQMPIEVEDLRMTPIFTVSRGATASPESGVMQDFGTTVKIGVTSEDNLYYSLYEVNVNYPHSSADFSTLAVNSGSYDYGTDFNMDFIKFPSSAQDGNLVKFYSFGRSDTPAGTIPADKTLAQFYPAVTQKGKSIMVSTSYDDESAATIEFTRPVDVDTITFTPSMLMKEAIINGLTLADYGVDVSAMNSEEGDYLKICYAGYDAEGNLTAVKEFYIADFSYAQNTFARMEKQTFNLLTSKIRNIKKLKIYLSGKRTDIPAVFFMDELKYKIRPQVMPDEE